MQGKGKEPDYPQGRVKEGFWPLAELVACRQNLAFFHSSLARGVSCRYSDEHIFSKSAPPSQVGDRWDQENGILQSCHPPPERLVELSIVIQFRKPRLR